MKWMGEFVVTGRRSLTASIIAFCILSVCNSAAFANEKWVGTWASAQQGVNTTFGGTAPVFNNQTLRQIVRVSIGGSTVRVRFSNVMSPYPLTINAASIAKSVSDATIADGSLRALTFSGSDSITIPDGAFVVSDPVSLDVQSFDDLAISLYLAEETTVLTQHGASLQTNYVSGTGD